MSYDALTRNFPDSIQTNSDFHRYISQYCFKDHVVTICMGLSSKVPCFMFAHTKIRGCISFVVLNRGKNWCVLFSFAGTGIFVSFCPPQENFLRLMQGCPR